jgi:5-methylcytosine-specific restriction endonuclease McrA
MDPNSTTRRCSKCRHDLDTSNFAKTRSTKDGFQSWCKDCRRAYYQANRERIKAQTSTYQKTNVENVRAYHRAYRDRNRERDRAAVRARSKAWYEANKERALTRSRLVVLANPERTRAIGRAYYRRNVESRRANTRRYFREHPEKNRELASRRRAREREAFIDQVNYEAIWLRDSGICHLCGGAVERSACHFDHVIPLAKGGAHSMENIKVAHARCNLRKGSKVL